MQSNQPIGCKCESYESIACVFLMMSITVGFPLPLNPCHSPYSYPYPLLAQSCLPITHLSH